MAGSHPDYPGNRFALNDDGTVGRRVNRAGVSDALDLSVLSTETGASVGYWPAAGAGSGAGGYVAVVFPEVRDVVGWYVRMADEASLLDLDVVYWAADTSNGVDGTWTSASVGWLSDDSASVSADWRDNVIAPPTTLRCNGLRFGYTGLVNDLHLSHLHVFGERTPGRLHGLELFGEVARLTAAEHDWGDVPVGSSADLRFRVKNTSASVTCDGIELTIDAPTDTTPSVAAQHYLSLDFGDTFSASVAFTTPIEPGDVTGSVILRRVTPTSASVAPGEWAVRVKAHATGWRTSAASVAVPHGDTIDYFLEGDVDAPGVEAIPHLWWLAPTTAHKGDEVEMVGYGLGDTQGDSTIQIYQINDGAEIEPPATSWEGVPATGSALGPARSIRRLEGYADPAHQVVTFVVPENALEPLVTVIIDTG